MSLFVTTSILTLFGCSPSPPWINSFNSASTFSVYEGLPHQLREAELLEQEKKRPDITMIGGFPFYTPSLAVNQDQTIQFKKVLGNKNLYYTFTGEPKDCGPFHPDFAVEWTVDETPYRILICFGCAEAQIWSNDLKEEYDIAHLNDVKSLLPQYSLKRPKN